MLLSPGSVETEGSANFAGGAAIASYNAEGDAPNPRRLCLPWLDQKKGLRLPFFSSGFMEIKDFQDTGLRPRVSLPDRRESKKKSGETFIRSPFSCIYSYQIGRAH